MDTLSVPGQTAIVPEELMLGSNGELRLIAQTVGPPDLGLTAFAWEESSWVQKWAAGFETGLLQAAVAPPGRYEILWKTRTAFELPNKVAVHLVYSEDLGVMHATPETVTTIWAGASEFAAAASDRRRWVALCDNPEALRLLYSDTAGVWREIPVTGHGGLGVTVAALNDTTALVVSAGWEGLDVGIVSGSTWYPDPRRPGRNAIRPKLRPRPSGGIWLLWARTVDHLFATTFRGTADHFEWAEPETLRYELPWETPVAFMYDCIVSQDGGEYPAFASVIGDVHGGFHLVAAAPSDVGFGTGHGRDSYRRLAADAIARDLNGDTWYVWWHDAEGMFWSHTYTRAEVSGLHIRKQGRALLLEWDLTTPAPDSWWSVLRADHRGPFTVVSRIQAEEVPRMSWCDPAPVDGPVRYRIRRDHLDSRYRWESEIVQWPARSRSITWQRIAIPGGPGIRMQLSGAAPGILDVEVFDVTGRAVWHERRQAVEGQPELFTLGGPHQRLVPGVYFLRARDAGGLVAERARIVVLD